MNIPLFAFLICTMYITFYSGDEIEAWAKRWGVRLKRFKLQALIPQGQQLKPNAANFLQAVDPLGLVDYERGSEPVWKAGDAKDAVRAIWSRSLGAWPMGVVPGLWRKVIANSTEPAVAEAVVEDRSKSNRPAKKAHAKH